VSGISSVVGKKDAGQLQLKFILEIKKGCLTAAENCTPIVGRHFNFTYWQGNVVNILRMGLSEHRRIVFYMHYFAISSLSTLRDIHNF
jgi:hypothetical protein